MKRLSILLIVLLQACAMGPAYQAAPAALHSQALVYMFRGDVQYGGGYATKFYINDTEVVGLYDSGYSWIHLDSGSYKFKAGGSKIELDVEAGKTYYLGMHQETKITGTLRRTWNIFKSYPRDEVFEQLSESRYKKSSSLSGGTKAKSRDFKSTAAVKSAEIRFTHNKTRNPKRPQFGVSFFDKPEICVDGRQNLTVENLNAGNVAIPAGELVSLIVSSREPPLGSAQVWCANTISFIPEVNQAYTVKIKSGLDVNFKKGSIGNCTVEIINDGDNKPVDILARTKPIKYFGSSPNCDPDDIQQPNWVKIAKNKANCSLTTTTKTQFCN